MRRRFIRMEINILQQYADAKWGMDAALVLLLKSLPSTRKVRMGKLERLT